MYSVIDLWLGSNRSKCPAGELQILEKTAIRWRMFKRRFCLYHLLSNWEELIENGFFIQHFTDVLSHSQESACCFYWFQTITSSAKDTPSSRWLCCNGNANPCDPGQTLKVKLKPSQHAYGKDLLYMRPCGFPCRTLCRSWWLWPKNYQWLADEFGVIKATFPSLQPTLFD